MGRNYEGILNFFPDPDLFQFNSQSTSMAIYLLKELNSNENNTYIQMQRKQIFGF